MFAKIKNHWPFWISAVLLAAMILSPLFGNHYFRNLEPYPDGLMYLVPPLEFLNSGRWEIVYNDTSLKPNVPPLYSWLMLPLMMVWRSPDVFIVLNFLLSLGTLWFLYLSLRKIVKTNLPMAGMLLVYSTNAVIWWYASLPMAENLGLFLISAAIYSLTNKHKHAPVQATFIAIGFILTKYIYYPVGLVLAMWAVLKLFKEKRYPVLSAALLVLVTGLIISIAVQIQQDSGPLLEIIEKLMGTSKPELSSNETDSTLVFFDNSFIPQNLKFYLENIFGSKQSLLWLKVSMISPIISLLAAFGAFVLWKKQKISLLVMIGLYFAQFGLLYNFYVQDIRYGILSIVILIFFAGVGLVELQKLNKNRLFVPSVVFILLLIQLVLQLDLAKQVISANVLHRSQSWQFQSVKHFSQQQELDANAYLITALPPFLISTYENPEYKILPLSRHQEFLAKDQNVWSTELADKSLLPDFYKKLLQEEKKLFVSNAYVTHQQAVIDDFENLKTQFNLELVSEGCEKTCNLYKLSPIVIVE